MTVVASSEERRYKASTTGQVQRMMRELEEYRMGSKTESPVVSYAIKIQSGIDLASRGRPSLSVFLARLQKLQIDPKLRIEKGKIAGISYRLQDFKIRGCKLHQASYSQLLEHRVIYNPQQDMFAVIKANQNETIGLESELEVDWDRVEIKDYMTNKIKLLSEIASKEQGIHTARKPVVLEHTRKSKELEIEF
ncbi:MAG: hypothetical protein AAFO95_21680 [Cyanobacteria bacterium J06600_6]